MSGTGGYIQGLKCRMQVPHVSWNSSFDETSVASDFVSEGILSDRGRDHEESIHILVQNCGNNQNCYTSATNETGRGNRLCES